jgi:hypothetical protein
MLIVLRHVLFLQDVTDNFPGLQPHRGEIFVAAGEKLNRAP